MATKADDEFKAFFKDSILGVLLPKAREIIAKGEDHAPMLAEFDRFGKMSNIGLIVGMDDPVARDAVAMLHRQLGAKASIYAAVLISECWTVWRSRTTATPAGSLADEPDRTEALAFNARHADQQLVAYIPIIRPNGPDGDKVGSTLGEAEVIDGIMGVGRMANEPKGPDETTIH